MSDYHFTALAFQLNEDYFEKDIMRSFLICLLWMFGNQELSCKQIESMMKYLLELQVNFIKEKNKLNEGRLKFINCLNIVLETQQMTEEQCGILFYHTTELDKWIDTFYKYTDLKLDSIGSIKLICNIFCVNSIIVLENGKKFGYSNECNSLKNNDLIIFINESCKKMDIAFKNNRQKEQQSYSYFSPYDANTYVWKCPTQNNQNLINRINSQQQQFDQETALLKIICEIQSDTKLQRMESWIETILYKVIYSYYKLIKTNPSDQQLSSLCSKIHDFVRYQSQYLNQDKLQNEQDLKNILLEFIAQRYVDENQFHKCSQDLIISLVQMLKQQFQQLKDLINQQITNFKQAKDICILLSTFFDINFELHSPCYTFKTENKNSLGNKQFVFYYHQQKIYTIESEIPIQEKNISNTNQPIYSQENKTIQIQQQFQDKKFINQSDLEQQNDSSKVQQPNVQNESKVSQPIQFDQLLTKPLQLCTKCNRQKREVYYLDYKYCEKCFLKIMKECI